MDEAVNENLRLIQEAITVFSSLGIAYALGGSWASTVHGKARLTQDADFTVEPFAGQEAAFCASFGSDYYISLPAVEEAIRRRSSFNIIHSPSSFKFDVFIRKNRPFDESLMRRRCALTLPEAPQQPIQFVSAEDIILLKLEWFRVGGESSERQWHDVLEVFRAQGNRLDQAYLGQFAADLKVDDLLARARREAIPA